MKKELGESHVRFELNMTKEEGDRLDTIVESLAEHMGKLGVKATRASTIRALIHERYTAVFRLKFSPAQFLGSAAEGFVDLFFFGLLCRFYKTVLQPAWPDGGILDLDVSDAADSGLHTVNVSGNQFFGYLDLDAEHQFVAFAARLDLFWGELCFR